MRSLALVALVASTALAQLPFSFDGGLPDNPTLVEQRRQQLLGRLPAWVAVPPTFETLTAAPDGINPHTVSVSFFPEVKAQFLRAASIDAGAPPMTWPAPVICARTAAFTLPAGSFLASGAPGGCATHEASIRSALSTATLSACLDVEEPERYVNASRAPAGATDSQLRSFADARTNTLEQQIALAGAGFALVPPPEGLLPADWVPTMRRVLWKIRPLDTTALTLAQNAITSAQSTLTTQSSCFDQTIVGAWPLAQMNAELSAVEAHVNQVIAQGTQRASEQVQCLNARGRTRPTLPYPALTDEEREFVAFWLGGVYWRFRGGGFLNLNATQSARTFFARRPFREIARLSNAQAVGNRAADSIYCGLFDGWGSWFDMGTYRAGPPSGEDNQDAYYDLVQMTERGRQHVADFPTEASACWLNGVATNVNKGAEEYLRDDGYDSQLMYAAGLDFGPCYLHALNPLKDFTWFTTAQTPSPYTNMFEGFTTMGEFCVGSSLGLALTRSFLNGTSTGMAPTNLCQGRMCGSDICGTSCGTCPSTQVCSTAGFCVMPVDAGSPDAGIDAGAPIGGGGGSATGGGGGSATGGGGGSASGGGAPTGGGATGGGAPTGGASGGGAPTGGGATGGGSAMTTGGGGGGGEMQPGGCGCTSIDLPLALSFAAVLLRRKKRANHSHHPS